MRYVPFSFSTFFMLMHLTCFLPGARISETEFAFVLTSGTPNNGKRPKPRLEVCPLPSPYHTPYGTVLRTFDSLTSG